MFKLQGAQKTGLLLGLFSLVLWFFFGLFPELAEHAYARGFYPLLANALSFIGNAFPFALTGLIFAGFSLWFLWIPVREFSKRQSRFSWLAPSVFSILSTGGLLLFLACLTFLLNHHRYSEEKLYALDFELNEPAYHKLVEHSVEEAEGLSEVFPQDERGCSDIDFTLESYDALIKAEQALFLESQGLPALSRANARYFLFSDIWSGLGVSGQYQPFFAQPNLASAIPEFSKPFVLAHERAHLNGFASEAGANLLAAQTLLHSRHEGLRYLALLELWRKNPPEATNERIKKDLQCWAEDWEKVKRFKYESLFRKMNDTYLKLSGHPDGVQSYGRGKLLALKYYYKNFVPGE